uniref:Uncharacterized protein n=1 Tax=Siphoviridae sp. ctRiO19 TaxID=2826337 RepID=A0A8S5LXB8_9CAUD|nr:MAG TPA: protein of unknown function DUF859 [Siphoviridae sp. ctRiO19]
MSSGDLDVEHDNEGDKQITVKLIAWFYSLGSKTAEQNFQIDNIPRKGSFEVQPRCIYKEENIIDIYYKPDKPIKSVQYSIIENGVYSKWNNIEVISGDWKTGATFRIKNLKTNTDYSIKVRIDTFGNGLYRESNELRIRTLDIPHLIQGSIPKIMQFYDNPKIEVYNPLSRPVWIVMNFIFENGTKEPVIFKKITNTIFNEFNDDEIWKKMLQYSSLITNGFNCELGLSKSSETPEMYDRNIIHFEYKNVRGPSFSNFEYRDINTDVKNITKNDQVIIKGLSDLEVVISFENSMYPHDYALDSYYNFRCDTNFLDRVNSNRVPEESTKGNLGKIMHAGEKVIEVTAYDTRRLGMTIQKVINVYDYNKPILYLDAIRKNKFENETALNIKGTFDLLNINNKNINKIKSIKYRYKEINGEFNAWNNINFSIKNNEYIANKIILNLENTNEYVIEVIVEDNFKETKESINVASGLSIFSIRTDGNCYVGDDKVTTERWNGAYSAEGHSNLEFCSGGRIQTKPEVLFSNWNGDNSDTITLNKNIYNYNRLLIYYKDTVRHHVTSKIVSARNSLTTLDALSTHGDNIRMTARTYLINNTTLQSTKSLVILLPANTRYEANELAILEIDGFK